MKELGIDVFLVPAAQTTHMRVIHPTADVDVRQMFQEKNAGFFTIEEMPDIQTKWLHLAGITDREFTFDFIAGLKKKNFHLSTDMQSFVRQVDPKTREIFFKDVPDKKAIFGLIECIKLDIVEAKILTGMDNLELAAMAMDEWGCSEIVITQSEGVLARVSAVTYYEQFSNSSIVGRTGRGDTTFAAYLARRMEYCEAESLKFAAALVSIKMETPGPFRGTFEDVLARMQQKNNI
jgi:sugar/nucleoside kinase (ribokinase family)